MSLTLIAIAAGGGLLVAGVTARWALKRRRAPAEASETETRAAAAPKAKPPSDALGTAGFEVELGDVIEVLGRELWLEEGWLLAEAGDPLAALFRANEHFLIALPPPTRRLYVTREIEVTLPAEHPATIEWTNVRFERLRRIPVEITPLGKSPPLPWDDAVLGEYRGLAGEALWVLGRGGRNKVWQGHIVSDSDVERWGGGASTLER